MMGHRMCPVHLLLLHVRRHLLHVHLLHHTLTLCPVLRVLCEFDKSV